MSSEAGFEDAVRRFLDHFEKISNCADEDVFLKEFMTLKTQSQRYRENNTYPMEAGQLPCNKKKNRFKDILPFEYTRVSLHPIEGVEGSDYINSNYIMGLDDQVTYIASQGPLPHTISDFWRMLWYHNIEIVVMACKIVEMAKPKCERYWPEVKQTMKIGAIQVTTPIEPPKVSAANNDSSVDAVYQNAEIIASAKKTMEKGQNSSSSSVGAGSLDGGGGEETQQQEKKKPVPRARNSVRNRGSPAAAAGSEPVPMLSQSPTLLEEDTSLRGGSVSPDLRNNAPSRRPKPRGKRSLGEGGDSSSSSDSGTRMGTTKPQPPLPFYKPQSGSSSSTSPSHRASPPEPLPKVPKTMVTNTTTTTSAAAKKKPLPVPPPRESTPERRLGSTPTSSSSSSINKRSSTGSQDRTTEVLSTTEADEDPYSSVDRTQFTDTGPSIQVLDVSSGKSLPLEFVEKEMESVGEADTSKSSILDTIMLLVGDEVLDNVEQNEMDNKPATFSATHRDFDFGDEAPPIPAHTIASMELVEQPPPSSSRGSRGGGGTSVAMGGVKEDKQPPPPVDTMSSTYDVVGAITDSVYEQPEPPKLAVPAPASSQKSSSYHGPHVRPGSTRGLAPPLPPANKSMDSSSTAAAISTMSRNTSDSTMNNGHAPAKHKKGLFSAFGRKDKKKDKDKVLSDDISGAHVIGNPGIVKSPSSNTMSSSTSSSHSPMHDRANNKYTFPGDYGYGIRIKKPVGPRREPPHWSNSLSLPIANKA